MRRGDGGTHLGERSVLPLAIPLRFADESYAAARADFGSSSGRGRGGLHSRVSVPTAWQPVVGEIDQERFFEMIAAVRVGDPARTVSRQVMTIRRQSRGD